MAKERGQNPTVTDEITLRLFAYNSNMKKDFASIEQVDLYFLDPEAVSETNLDGRTLVTTITDITNDATGEYHVTFTLEEEQYVIGRYLDVWLVTMQGSFASTVEQEFEVYPSLWFTTPLPLAYDFSFDFRPNKFRQGSKQHLIVHVTPNVPTASDLAKYYAALIVTSPINIYIEMECVECMPQETDLRMVVDGENVPYRDGNNAFYLLDTTEEGLDLNNGIYNVWFDMELGDSLYISDKQQFQIY